jgi:phosphohistidine swiveling domain-containing protein
VTGKPVFTSEDAVKESKNGPVILVTKETTPDDIAGMKAAVGVVTMTGGATSHAAVVARGETPPIPCVVGVGSDLKFFKTQDELTIDGATGRIWTGKIPTVSADVTLIEKYKKVLFKALNVSPIIFDVPSEEMEEALYYPGALIVSIPALITKLNAISGKVKKLYIDVTGGQHESEKAFGSMFTKADGAVVNVLEQLFQPKEGHEVVLIGATSKKFASIGTTDNLETAILSTKTIAVSGAVSPAMKKVLDWKKAEGVETVTIGQLTEGKSIVSFEELIHSAK